MRRLSLPLSVILITSLSGCYVFRGTAPILDYASREAPGSRPGGLGDRDSVRYVIHISVDGLRPDAVERLGFDAVPAFTRLRDRGAWTHNARSDRDYRITLPNHTTQLTGHPVVGPDGHHWTVNVDPAPGVTIHSNRGAYIPSVFDVAHDNGLQTAAYVSKSKFSLYRTSYDAEHGAPDTTGVDDGREKIDTFVYQPDTDTLVDRLVADLADDPAAYTFLHIRDPDSRGHIMAWSMRRGSPYLRAVEHSDMLIGRILALVDDDPRLAGHTAIIVTADHGGSGRGHARDRREHYTVPFYVWSPGVPRADLYALNKGLRVDPGTGHIPYSAELQPIRNGDAANLALAFLGLPPVPGSTIGAAVPLRVRPDVPVTVDPTGAPAGTPSEAPRDTVRTH
ncbi:alkaline phosphatase family protein [Rubrivirga sp. IMCC43871]|uniref:alkaline phosphatase family protein n=1 Tax=Rubrivirga sp. IMCC43871 TaxID=3391575 RepID=UPI00398FD370